jgi:energy-coupling factor transport system permease protein
VAPTAYHRLNPLTKATLAAALTVAAIGHGGYAVPALLLATAVIAGAAAGLLDRALRIALLVSLPVLLSVVLVSLLTREGETVLVVLGPFDITLEGIDIAARISLRLFVAALALTVFGLTTDARSLVADLERRGIPQRLTFAAAAALEAVPAMVERARTVAGAQRARGLDTEGSVGARLRGVRPLVGPVLLSAIAEVDARSLALEARAFGRPGPRQPLWAPADSPSQRVARWAMIAGVVVLIALRAAGPLAGIP